MDDSSVEGWRQVKSFNAFHIRPRMTKAGSTLPTVTFLFGLV